MADAAPGYPAGHDAEKQLSVPARPWLDAATGPDRPTGLERNKHQSAAVDRGDLRQHGRVADRLDRAQFAQWQLGPVGLEMSRQLAAASVP